MENLAGKVDCDRRIRGELEKAGIDIIQLPAPMKSEVPASVIGQLPGFRFHRNWYYWVVKGQVPLPVARELYANPNGREDIRVAGHAGCPPPEDWVEHFDKDGKRLFPLEEEATLKAMEESYQQKSEFVAEIIRESRANSRFVEDPKSVAAKSVITTYHIDTQEGLNFFVSTLKLRDVIPGDNQPEEKPGSEIS